MKAIQGENLVWAGRIRHQLIWESNNNVLIKELLQPTCIITILLIHRLLCIHILYRLLKAEHFNGGSYNSVQIIFATGCSRRISFTPQITKGKTLHWSSRGSPVTISRWQSYKKLWHQQSAPNSHKKE